MALTLLEWRAAAGDAVNYIPMIGGSPLLHVLEIEGFGPPSHRYLTSSGPGLAKAKPREVIPELPHEMAIRGIIKTGSLESTVRSYAGMLDAYTRNGSAYGAVTPNILKITDAVGTLQRDVVTKSVILPRQTTDWDNRAFEFVFESYDPAWYNPTQQTQSLTLGASTVSANTSVTNNGYWPVYPTFTFTTAGGGGVTNITIKNQTDNNKQLTFNLTIAAGTTLSIDMDPFGNLATVNGTSVQYALNMTDRRFMLLKGSNTITTTFTGTAPTTARIEWYEKYPGV